MRFDLINVWWSALYGQEGKPNCALALHAQDTRCENLGFVDITNEAAVFPAEMNVLLVMQSDDQLVPSPVFLRALQDRRSPTMLMLGRPSKSGLNVLKWWIDHDNCEVIHTPLQSDELSFAPHSISEALCVGTASIVSLLLLVIIAVTLLPTAPTLP